MGAVGSGSDTPGLAAPISALYSGNWTQAVVALVAERARQYAEVYAEMAERLKQLIADLWASRQTHVEAPNIEVRTSVTIFELEGQNQKYGLAGPPPPSVWTTATPSSVFVSEPSPSVLLEDAVPEKARRRTERIEEWARARGGSQLTVRRNREQLESFFLVLSDLGYGTVPPTGVTAEMVDRYKHDGKVAQSALNVKRGYAGRPIAPNVVYNTLSRVRLFCEFNEVRDTEGRLLSDQNRHRRLWRMAARPESVYVSYLESPADLRSVLNAAGQHPSRGIELQAMVILAGACELRNEVARNVKPSDMRLTLEPGKRSYVRVVRGKFGKPQEQDVPPSVVPVLMNAAQGREPNAPIWKWSAPTLSRDLKRTAATAGVPNANPHTLRRSVSSFAANEAACRPTFVQDRMNHASWATTERYYLRRSPRAQAEDLAKLDAVLREG